MSGRKPAVRQGDLAGSHDGYPPTPAMGGSIDILINGRPAVRQGDPAVSHTKPDNPPHPRAAAEGSATVFINGKPAVRVGDGIDCGSSWIKGSTDVLIGDDPGFVAANNMSGEEPEALVRAYIREDVGADPYQRRRIAARVAVKYRGSEGALASWRQYYDARRRSHEALPEPRRIADPLERAALLDVEPGLWDRIVDGLGYAAQFFYGGIAELVNTLARADGAERAQRLAERGVEFRDPDTGEVIPPARVAEAVREQGRDTLAVQDPTQQAGAAAAGTALSVAAVTELLRAVLTRGRSLRGDADALTREISQALRTSRSRSREEALGRLGQIQAKRRLNETTDPRYVDRYHGPDDMTSNRRLTEWEAKDGKGDRPVPARNAAKERQGSRAKNKRRAKQTTRAKAKKIGQPSNRQGGPYTAEEIDLWREIQRRRGNKRHLLSHTNTETGRVQVFEQDDEGNLGEVVDDFHIEDFDVAKDVIGKAFQR